jgi:hypothetical protein
MKRLLTLVLLLALALSPARAYAPDCDKIDTLAAALGGELVPWQGYPQGWNLPTDIQFFDTTDFDDDGGVWDTYSPSTGEHFIWYYVSYIVDGDPSGMHNFCGPYKTKP